MKNLFLFVATSLLFFSCSRTFENKETEYDYNVKGFYKTTDEENVPVYSFINIKSVTEDWDGGVDKDFEPAESGDKLIKIEVRGYLTNKDFDLGKLETGYCLFDASSKKTYNAIPRISVTKGPTFPGLISNDVDGFFVFSVPKDAKINDLYIGLNENENPTAKVDLSKENINNLLPLKPFEIPASETVNVNSKIVEKGWNGTVTYTIKNVTKYADDDKIKEHIKAEKEQWGELYSAPLYFKVEGEIESTGEESFLPSIYLLNEYNEINLSISEISNKPESMDANGKQSFTLYYIVQPNKITGVNIGNQIIEIK